MFCIKCGKEIPENSQFCKYCGTDLREALEEKTNTAFTPKPQFIQRRNKSAESGQGRKVIPFIGAAAAAIVVILLFANGIIGGGQSASEYDEDAELVKVPDIIGQYYEDAIKITENESLLLIITGKGSDEKIPADSVLSQNPKAKSKIPKDSALLSVISGGAKDSEKTERIPDVSYLSHEEAIAVLETEEISCNAVYIESDCVLDGLVVNQRSYPSDDTIGSIAVEICISTGSDAQDEALEKGKYKDIIDQVEKNRNKRNESGQYEPETSGAEMEGSSEGDLREILQSKTSKEILSFDYGDFDSDGKYEAFAFVGEPANDANFDPYCGDLWFVDADNAQLLEEDGWFWKINEKYTFGRQSFIVLEEYFATGSKSHIWGVRNGKPSRESFNGYCGGFQQVNEKDLTLESEAYDGDFFDGNGMGHTWKEYYFFWDENEEAFHEYGGIEITKAQLLRYDNAKTIFDEIEKSSWPNVGEIYYRGNNIININIFSGDLNNGSFNNVTLLVEKNSVNFKQVGFSQGSGFESSTQGGIFEAAINPSIAVYPKAFPMPN